MDALRVGVPKAAKGAAPAPQAHGGEVEDIDGEGAVDLGDLRQVRNVARVEAKALDRAAERRERAGDALGERRFAGPVRPDDGDEAARVNLEVEVMHRRVPVVAERQVAAGQRQAHRSAQTTPPQIAATSVAAMASRPTSDRRSSENPAGAAGCACGGCACGASPCAA